MREKTKAEDCDWAERQQFLTAFCLVPLFWLFPFSLMPAFYIFFSRLAAFTPCRGFPHESVGWRQLGGMERREKHRRRERLHLKACVCGLQSDSTSTLDATTQPSQAQHRASRLYPGKLGPDTSWCVIEMAHQLFGLIITHQDSVCCYYFITIYRLCWLACFA